MICGIFESEFSLGKIVPQSVEVYFDKHNKFFVTEFTDKQYTKGLCELLGNLYLVGGISPDGKKTLEENLKGNGILNVYSRDIEANKDVLSKQWKFNGLVPVETTFGSDENITVTVAWEFKEMLIYEF